MASSRSWRRVVAGLWTLAALAPARARSYEAWFPAVEARVLAESVAASVPSRAAAPALGAGAAEAVCRAALAGMDAASGAGRAERLACLEAAFAARVSPGRASGGSRLAPEEGAAVDKYVDHFAYLLNKALRTGDAAFLRRHARFIETLSGALDRSPVFRGVVFRGADFPPPVSRLEEDADFVDPAFVSTSRSWEIAEHYTKSDGWLYAFLSRSGRVLAYDRAIQDLSAEDEVLFKPGTRFVILAVVPQPELRRTVILAEEAP